MTVAPPLKVLVINDEPAIRILIRVNFKNEGMDVVEAADGSSGMV